MGFDNGDSVTAHNFGLQIDGVMVEYLQGVSGLSQKQDVIEFKQNSANGKPVTRKLPGVAQAGECTVTRGMTQSKAFNDWINSSLRGDMGSARKNASVILMDYQSNPVRRYHMRNAWCSAVEAGNPEAGGASALTEQVTITFEELTIE